MKILNAKDNIQIKRVSRWIKVRHKIITKRHKLYDYSDDGNLWYFTHKGEEYAIGQFIRLGYPIMWEENDKLQYLSGYDCINYYNPLHIEIEDGGEYIRLYVVVFFQIA